MRPPGDVNDENGNGCICIQTFEYDQDQANIAQSHESVLPRYFKNVGQRFPVDDANRNLADNTGPNNFCRHPFGQGQEEEE